MYKYAYIYVCVHVFKFHAYKVTSALGRWGCFYGDPTYN